MRLKLDENITVALKQPLVGAGHDVESVLDEGMRGAPDGEVFAACRREDRLLITADVGFGDIRAYPPGSHPGILLLRLRDQHPANTLDVVARVLATHDFASFVGALVVVSEDSVRIRRES